jgi:hypothetical protein
VSLGFWRIGGNRGPFFGKNNERKKRSEPQKKQRAEERAFSPTGEDVSLPPTPDPHKRVPI